MFFFSILVVLFVHTSYWLKHKLAGCNALSVKYRTYDTGQGVYATSREEVVLKSNCFESYCLGDNFQKRFDRDCEVFVSVTEKLISFLMVFKGQAFVLFIESLLMCVIVIVFSSLSQLEPVALVACASSFLLVFSHLYLMLQVVGRNTTRAGLMESVCKAIDLNIEHYFWNDVSAEKRNRSMCLFIEDARRKSEAVFTIIQISHLGGSFILLSWRFGIDLVGG